MSQPSFNPNENKGDLWIQSSKKLYTIKDVLKPLDHIIILYKDTIELLLLQIGLRVKDQISQNNLSSDPY